MLESCHDQGAGLRLQMPQTCPRLAALIGHGDTDTELPLLWQLCDALQSLGYRVAVLDASRAESFDTPGLQGLLDGSLSADDELDPSGSFAAVELSIFPAHRGLASLVGLDGVPDFGASARLGRALHSYDIAVLYGSAAQLAEWAGHCAIAPVLPAAPRKSSLLAVGKAVKTLADAGVLPTLASVVTRPGIATAGVAQAARENLARCAAYWLGREIDVLRVRSAPEGEPASTEVHRLALRLIEGAATLATVATPLAPAPDAAAFVRHGRTARSH
ncbi:hypothetical protein GT347_08200 [Xylophilus rhododendri]|uniref:Uncharacterized protein n=1 Tax=Xylophilus rhododendri TaxID=2697032 RepID=A0A857J2U9_9BURK|nr:hypothetical protein [Xylophilus rhododendri]QHI97977.1 hypothetical protein GT347_08200 [Xylophilus rhododendri]